MREKRNTYRIFWEGRKERGHWEDQDVGGWTILKWILREIGWDGVEWIDMTRHRDQWRTLVNTIRNLGVPENAAKFLSGCTISCSSRRAELRE
jgi:hypothetical protein